MARRVVTPWRTRSSNSAQRAFPAAFAWYSAVSASRSTVSGSRPVSVDSTSPMLADTLTSRPAMVNGGVRAVDEAAGDPLGLGGVAHVGADDDELVAAETGHEVVGPDGVGEPVGHGQEELVARLVAEGVVDELEVVEVDEQHRHRRLRPGELLAQRLPQQAPVGEAGQAVVGGVVGQGLLEEAALGDVLHRADEAAGPLADEDGRHPDRHPAGRAVGPLHLDLVDLGLGAFQHALEGGDDPGPVGRGQRVEPAAAVDARRR